MLALKTVLFPTDFSAMADTALDYAIALAEKHGATLHLLHAVVLHADDPNDAAHHFPDTAEIEARLEGVAERRMQERLEERGVTEIEVVRAQRRGISTAPVILEYAEEVEADVIVMSTHGRRGLSHALIGSVTEEVVRLSPRPVLTIRAAEKGPIPVGIERVLVPVDFSPHSERAVEHAIEVCRIYEGQLHLLHVFEQPVTPEVYVGAGSAFRLDFSTQEASLRQALRDLADRMNAGDGVEVHVREGRAVAGILAAAEEMEADLIVIATHGLGGLTHVLLGSVTEKVVRRAPCPVLTIKAFGRSLLH